MRTKSMPPPTGSGSSSSKVAGTGSNSIPPPRPPPMAVPRPPLRSSTTDMNTSRAGSLLSQYDFSNYRNRVASTISDANWDNESVISSIMDGSTNDQSSNISASLSSLQYNSNYSIGSSESILPLLKNELETTLTELKDSRKENESLKVTLEELKCVMAEEYLRYQKHLTAVTGHNGGPLPREGTTTTTTTTTSPNMKEEVRIDDNSTVNSKVTDDTLVSSSNTTPFIDSKTPSTLTANVHSPTHGNTQPPLSSSSSIVEATTATSSEFTSSLIDDEKEQNTRLLAELAEQKDRADRLESQLLFAKKEREKAIKLLISVVGRDRVNRILYLNAGVPNILDVLIEQLGPSHDHGSNSNHISSPNNDAKRSSPSKLHSQPHTSSPNKFSHFKNHSPTMKNNGNSNSNSKSNSSNKERSPSPNNKSRNKVGASKTRY